MTDFATRSASEARALELLDAAVTGDRWSVDRATVALVFRACWSGALQLKRVVRISGALAGYTEESCATEQYRDAIQAELTKLVKEKVLRSWTRGKARFYEVNI